MSETRLHRGARWFAIEHGFFDHPKTLRAGEEAAFLFLAGLDYCGKNLTDGVIPKAMVARLTTKRNPAALAERLVAVGYWHDRGDHYESHEYLSRYPSRVHVETTREADRKRKRKGAGVRADSARNADGDAGDSPCLEVEVDVDREPTPPPPPSPAGSGSGFERFWTTWPKHFRKADKAGCRQVWTSRGYEAETAAIVADLTARLTHRNWRKEQGAYIPAPIKYLRAAPWREGVLVEAPAEGEDEEETILVVGRGYLPLEQARKEGLA